MARRFSKWKRDAQHSFTQDSLMFKRLLGNVVDDLVRARCSGLLNEMDYRYQFQAKGIDRPSFGATLIKNRDKYHLSEREQAWLAGSMVYVS